MNPAKATANEVTAKVNFFIFFFLLLINKRRIRVTVFSRHKVQLELNLCFSIEPPFEYNKPPNI